jgi:clostripain
MKQPWIRLIAAALLPLLFIGCGLFTRYTLTLSVENDTGGQIAADPSIPDYSENTIVSLTATSEEGWELDSWRGTTSSDGESATVLMDANRMVTAVFKPILSRSNPTDDIDNPPVVGFAPGSGDGESWTFMVYLDADNNLEPYSLLDFNEMEQGLSDCNNSDIEIIVLFDRRDDGVADTDWKDTRTYRIVADESSEIVSIQLTESSELNMGDPGTLTDFLNYCKTEASADHYALMFWNHGGGARSLSPEQPEVQSRHICQDEESGDFLFMDEVQQGIHSAFPGGLDVISMDACIMGTVEAAFEMRNLCDYYVASMSNVNAYGWDYADFFGRMTASASNSGGDALSALMVDSYRNSVSAYSDQSISAVNTDGLVLLKDNIDLLAVELYLADKKVIIEDIRDSAVNFFNDAYEAEVVSQPYYDLNDFCHMLISNEDYLSSSVTAAASVVLGTLEQAVLSAYAGPALGNYYGSGSDVKRGLSIFFSKGNLIYNNASHYASQYWYTTLDCSSRGPYGFIDFCSSDEDGIVETWRELMEVWYDPYRPPVGYTPGSW